MFCGEQGVSLAGDRDGRDADALHIVAVEQGRVIGTCRVVFDGEIGRLGRMAVERAARRRGIGSALLAEAELRARARRAQGTCACTPRPTWRTSTRARGT